MQNRTRPERHTISSYSTLSSSPPSRPFIIPVFLPHAGCPHQCVFCNQKIITHATDSLPFDSEIISFVHAWLKYRTPGRSSVQIAFFGGNFLGIEIPEIIRLLTIARQFVLDGSVDSIRFSTRPDTITPSHLELLAGFPVTTIEIGAQSMNDMVLELCQRGHTALDTVQAVHLLRDSGYTVGIQMMTGLPGSDASVDISSGLRIADLHPDFVRIYPAVVLDHSLLARWYRAGRYTPMPLLESVTLVKQLYLIFHEARIPVIRMGLQVSTDMGSTAMVLAGPLHPAFGHLVMAEIYRDNTLEILKRHHECGDRIWLGVHPRRVSVMRGLKNENIRYLSEQLCSTHIAVEACPQLSDHQIAWKIVSDIRQAEGYCNVFDMIP